jgi:hypothetical protein
MGLMRLLPSRIGGDEARVWFAADDDAAAADSRECNTGE